MSSVMAARPAPAEFGTRWVVPTSRGPAPAPGSLCSERSLVDEGLAARATASCIVVPLAHGGPRAFSDSTPGPLRH